MSWAADYSLDHPRRRHCATIEALNAEIRAHTWILQNTPKDVLSLNEELMRLKCIKLCRDELEERKW